MLTPVPLPRTCVQGFFQMLRFVVFAAVAVSALPTFAGDPKLRAHSHSGVASFSEPINYRPHNGEGRLIVRPAGYSEANTKILRSSTVGVTTQTNMLSAQAVTAPGRHSTGALILVDDSAND